MKTEYVIVWFAHPDYQEQDEFLADDNPNGHCGVWSYATKFSSEYDAIEFCKERRVPKVLGEGYFPYAIARVDHLEKARAEAEANMAVPEDEVCPVGQSPNDFQSQVRAYLLQLLTQTDENAPCNEPCPICGSLTVDRLYCHSAEALFETESYRVQPEIGKIHNGCACCEHEWLSDPLPPDKEA